MDQDENNVCLAMLAAVSIRRFTSSYYTLDLIAAKIDQATSAVLAAFMPPTRANVAETEGGLHTEWRRVEI
jgi:hypothetical protein